MLIFVISCAAEEDETTTATSTSDNSTTVEEGFVFSKSLRVSSATELDGASLCLIADSTEELLANNFFTKHAMSYEAVTCENSEEIIQNYDAGRCDGFVLFEGYTLKDEDVFLEL